MKYFQFMLKLLIFLEAVTLAECAMFHLYSCVTGRIFILESYIVMPVIVFSCYIVALVLVTPLRWVIKTKK